MVFIIDFEYLCRKTNHNIGVVKNNYYKLIDINYYSDGDRLIIFEVGENRKIAFSDKNFDSYYVFKYFYTKQEERRMKLNNLNDESR